MGNGSTIPLQHSRRKTDSSVQSYESDQRIAELNLTQIITPSTPILAEETMQIQQHWNQLMYHSNITNPRSKLAKLFQSHMEQQYSSLFHQLEPYQGTTMGIAQILLKTIGMLLRLNETQEERRTIAIRALADRHLMYGIRRSHFNDFECALLYSLEACNPTIWTVALRESWKAIYNYYTTQMLCVWEQYALQTKHHVLTQVKLRLSHVETSMISQTIVCTFVPTGAVTVVEHEPVRQLIEIGFPSRCHLDTVNIVFYYEIVASLYQDDVSNIQSIQFDLPRKCSTLRKSVARWKLQHGIRLDMPELLPSKIIYQECYDSLQVGQLLYLTHASLKSLNLNTARENGGRKQTI